MNPVKKASYFVGESTDVGDQKKSQAIGIQHIMMDQGDPAKLRDSKPERYKLRERVVQYALEHIAISVPFYILFYEAYVLPPDSYREEDGELRWEHEIVDTAERRFILFQKDNMICVMPTPIFGVPSTEEAVLERYGSIKQMVGMSYYWPNDQSGMVTSEEIERMYDRQQIEEYDLVKEGSPL